MSEPPIEMGPGADPEPDPFAGTSPGSGRQERFAAVFTTHQDRLTRMVQVRLDPRLHARIDPADALQELFLEASKRLEEYVERRPLPFFLWLRLLLGQKLQDLHRFHLGAQARDARKEVRLDQRSPEASSMAMAGLLAARDPSPSQALMRREAQAGVQEALERLDPLEREVLALRHFEGLTNVEAARELGLQESAASKRYIRALERLRSVLDSLPRNS